MSGGSYDYVSFKIEQAVFTLRERHPENANILALASQLEKIAKVMHRIEWADSGDESWTPELHAEIRALLHPGDDAREVMKKAKLLHEMIDRLLR